MSSYFVRNSDFTAKTETETPHPTPRTESVEINNYLTDTTVKQPEENAPHNSTDTDIKMEEGKTIIYDDMVFKVKNGALVMKSLVYKTRIYTSIFLPSAVNGLPVVCIDRNAFSNVKVKHIHVPGTVEEIDAHAFDGCTVERINIPPSISRIGEYTFANTQQLQEVDLSLSNIKDLAAYTFSNSAIKAVKLPEINKIQTNCFESCYRLEHFTLPHNLEEIESEAFLNCIGLKTLTSKSPADANIRVSATAFKGCVALENIPPLVMFRDNYKLFSDCKLLEKQYSNIVISELGTVLKITEPPLRFLKYITIPDEAYAIGSFALLDYSPKEVVLRLPKSIKLFHPNALLTKTQVKTIESDIVTTVDGYTIQARIEYQGTVGDWKNVTKLQGHVRYSVVVTCISDNITFIDYI